MSTLLVALLLAIILGVVIFLLTYSLNRVTRQVSEQFEARFRAADEIINHDRVPKDWIEGYRRKIQKVKDRAGDGAEIDRLGQRAKRHLIKRIKDLRRFLESGKYYDSLKTKELVVKTLREREQNWSASRWQDLLATTLSPMAAEVAEQENTTYND